MLEELPLKISICPQTTTVKKQERALKTSHPCFVVSFVQTAFNFLTFYHVTPEIRVGFKCVCPDQ